MWHAASSLSPVSMWISIPLLWSLSIAAMAPRLRGSASPARPMTCWSMANQMMVCDMVVILIASLSSSSGGSLGIMLRLPAWYSCPLSRAVMPWPGISLKSLNLASPLPT